MGGFFATLGKIAGSGSDRGRSRSRGKPRKRSGKEVKRQRSESSSSRASDDSWTRSKCAELRLIDYQKRVNKLNMEQLEHLLGDCLSGSSEFRERTTM